MKKVIIIGSGPAGVSAALYTVRGGVDTTIISNGVGSLGKAHEIQNYYGVSGSVSGMDLVSTGISQAKALGVKFIEDEVVGLTYEESLVVETASNRYTTDYVVIATGTSRNVPASLNVSDYEGKGVSCCAICDAFFYRNKNVAVLGNGEFALHEIKDLLPVASSVTLLTNGDELKTEMPYEVKVDTRKIKSFEGDARLKKVTFIDDDSIDVSGLFIALGTAGATALAKKIGAIIGDNGIVVDENKETSVPGVYAVGDCISGLKQVAKAVYDGAVAGHHIVGR